MKIGNLKLKNKLILAPMEDVTDIAYRILCKKYGAGLVFTPMIHAEALVRNKKIVEHCEEERPVGIQLTVNEVEPLKKIINILKEFDLVDINCGCPFPKITGNKLGASLLDDPEKISEIVKFLKEKLDIPVTVKIRLGMKKINVLENAKIIEKAGADAITVHARTAAGRYKTKADWSWIEKVRDSVKIPVIGNGDVFSGKDAQELLKKCDAVMIGRGAIGNPIIFKNILSYFKTGKEIDDYNERINSFFEYVALCKRFKIYDFKKIRRMSLYFVFGAKGSRKVRDRLSKSMNFDELEGIINQ